MSTAARQNFPHSDMPISQTITNLPWWRGASIYQIYPRSFADSNGDGIGDLPGITARLDHIASLGVDAIWISPFFTSPMHDYGYDVADYCDVDPMFGTLEDFDALVAKAHNLGLKVIIDQVYSHSSIDHPWFAESRSNRINPKADWYVWEDAKLDGSPPNNWQSVFGGPAWTWDARRGQYYLHNFLKEQPDLNLRHPDVEAAVFAAARFWLDRGVDGFRLDAVNFSMHNPALTDNPVNPVLGPRTRSFDFQLKQHNQSHPDIVPFLERLAAVIRSYGPDRFTVAEVGGDDADREMRLFTAGDARLDTAYGFLFLYAQALTASLVRAAITDWSGKSDGVWPSWAFENHDSRRALSRWAHGLSTDETAAFAQMKMMLLIALRGNIFLYQGEELGLPQADVPYERLRDPEAIANWPQTLGRDGGRTPMPWMAQDEFGGFSSVEPWLPMPEAHLDRAVSQQEHDPKSILKWTQDMLALRRIHAALRLGSIGIIPSPDPVLAFERSHGDSTLLCVFNMSASAAAWSPSGRWSILAGTQGAQLDGLPPFGCYIAQQI
jgi:alpha-glucosidase